jgi:hypothetical protein
MQSSRQSSEIREKPAINFKGTITRQHDETIYPVENITISGLYQKIPVYTLPDNKDIDPAEDITFIDLNEINQIYPTKPNPHDGIHSFKNRDYIEITIAWKDSKKSTENFIIEISRKIFCDRINEAGPLEKELSFASLKNLTITGYIPRDDRKKTVETLADQEKSAAQKALCGKTSHLINDLHGEAKNVQPTTSQQKIAEIAGDLENTTQALCS